jgi:hypothetical protein
MLQNEQRLIESRKRTFTQFIFGAVWYPTTQFSLWILGEHFEDSWLGFLLAFTLGCIVAYGVLIYLESISFGLLTLRNDSKIFLESKNFRIIVLVAGFLVSVGIFAVMNYHAVGQSKSINQDIKDIKALNHSLERMKLETQR